MDWFEGLPFYIEEDDFICVHAGIPIKQDGHLAPFSEVSIEELVNDRKFKNPRIEHCNPKCVLFGHTQTDYICGEPKILGYHRSSSTPAKSIRDFYKIHLDTGAWSNGILGCLCIDTLKTVYIKKNKSVH